ncbi:cilia- and flagella-associated protein 54-like isoform X5 [Convolutriloba macropyga]|uniref:cilia- and flagella-associated protein 54-like isoform X5 n=1 Tax=Convolutriloba macropyga TaxID=536237 RepID=UPI003F5258B3
MPLKPVKQLPSTYYDSTSKVNPVLTAFEQEYEEFCKFSLKRVEEKNQNALPEDDVYARGSNKLYKLWNSYMHRLPREYFIEKLMELGDFLCSLKEYEIALYQCYETYFAFTNIWIPDDKFQDLDALLATGHFSSTVDDAHTIRALIGAASCKFRIITWNDRSLQSKHSVENITQLLIQLRTASQLCLPLERLCWLVYNTTVHIYNICRHVMIYGHSRMALEFLLWASCCLETSIPLLSIRYLSWRSTLYVAVCQCYLDLKDPVHAESFAKRALVKIDELNELEKSSASKNDVTTVPLFRAATIRVGVVIFLRQIYEFKKRQRLMPNRPNKNKSLRDIANNSWPRTGTEKMLNEVFDGSAAQFLTILEVVNDPNKRTAFTASPQSEQDDIWSEVYSELFFAGAEIVAGGGGIAKEITNHVGIANVSKSTDTLMEMASKGLDGVTVESLIKFVKLAFCYEQWDSLFAMLEPAIRLLESGAPHVSAYVHEAQSLRIVSGLEQLHPNARKHRRFLQLQTESQATIEREGGDMPSTYQLNKQELRARAAASKKPETIEDWLDFSSIMLRCLQHPQGSIDIDIVVDACLYLWNKCRTVFSKIQTGSTDVSTYVKALQKTEQPQKMLQLMCEVQQVMTWVGMSLVDPLTMGDISLKVAYALELASSRSNPILKPWSMKSWSTVALLEYAVSNVNKGLEDIATYKDVTLSPSQWRSLADMTWMKNVEEECPSKEDSLHIRANTINDVHCELLFLYHRLCIRLAHHSKLQQERMLRNAVYKTKSVELQSEKDFIEKFEQKVRTNPFSTVMFLLARGYMLHVGNLNPQKIASVLEEALFLLDKIKEDDEDLYNKNLAQLANQKPAKSIPPAPILMKRSATYMMLKPGPFAPSSGQTVSWYRIFAKQITGPDAKVRLNDNLLNGTGIEVPAQSAHEFTVRNLIPGEKYVFAFAAYTSNGTLIGNHIGESTKPIVAYQALPVLTAYGFLAQVACITSQYRVAQQAFKHLWNHLVLPLDTTSHLETYTVSCQDQDLKINVYKVDIPTVQRSSPVFQRLFLINLFTSVDVAIRDGALYSNVICDRGPPYNQQVKRLRECEKLLVAIELSGMLNDAPLAFQAIVLSYGLVVPMIQNKLPSVPVAQILLRIHAVLTELPANLRVRKQQSITDCISHMIACITFHTARLLRIWKQKPLAREINSTGRKLLTNVDKTAAQIHQSDSSPRSGAAGGGAGGASVNGGGSHRGEDEMAEEQDQDQMGGGGEGGKEEGENPEEQSGETGDPSGAANPAGGVPQGAAGGAGGGDAPNAIADDNTDKASVAGTVRPTEMARNVLIANMPRKAPEVKPTRTKKKEIEQSDELRALQANMLRLSRNIQPSDELYGTEDPIVLHAYVASLPAKAAYREISKFKKKPSFIQFLVQVVSKSITEGKAIDAVDWCEDAFSWLTSLKEAEVVRTDKRRKKRQDQLNPNKVKGRGATVGPGGQTVDGDKKYGAVVSEVHPGLVASKNVGSVDTDGSGEGAKINPGTAGTVDGVNGTAQGQDVVAGANIPAVAPSTAAVSQTDRTKAEVAAEAKARSRRKNKLLIHYRKFIPGMSEAERSARLEQDEQALAKLENNLPNIFRTYQRKRRLRKVSFEEYPWRSQLNALHGVCIFSGLVKKLELFKVFESVDTTSRVSFLDIDLFTLDMAGRVVVGWPGASAEHPPTSRGIGGQGVGGGDGDSTHSTVLYLASRLVIGEIDVEKDANGNVVLPQNSEDFSQNAHAPATIPATHRTSIDTTGGGAPLDDRGDSPRSYRSDDSDAPNPPHVMPVPPHPKHDHGVSNATALGSDEKAHPTTSNGNVGGHGKSVKRGKKNTGNIVAPEKLSPREVKASLESMFLAFSRSVNLAERGGLWILAQNNIKMLWNIYQCLYVLITSSKTTSVLSVETLRACAAPTFLQVSLALHSVCVNMQLQLDQLFSKDKKPKRTMESSVFGTQEDEVGGSKLSFEKIADDLTLFDARFAYRIFLRTLELLYFNQQWETMTDIAFKINAITNCRFVEQVSPLLIYSQHKIIERVLDHNGPDMPQPSFAPGANARLPAYAEKYDSPVFRVTVPPGEELSENATNRYQLRHVSTVPAPSPVRSLQVASVPLDIDESVAELSRAMDHSQFVSHGLRHARRLLALYMAGHHLGGSKDIIGDAVRSESQVRIDRTPVYIPTTVPQDMKGLRFNSLEEVQFAAIPANQLSTVIKAYQHASDLLSAKKETGCQVQALHELGNLYLHQGNTREASRVWSQAIDILFKSNDVIKDWKKVTKSRFGDKERSQVILDKCGLWGSLMVGILVSKIAQYIMKAKVDPKLEMCHFATACFKAVFRSSLPYPLSDIDYASYSIGPDYSTPVGSKSMAELLPGLDITSDQFRCNSRTLVASLLYVTNELHRSNYNLTSLPTLTLCEFICAHACRDLKRTVLTRLTKIRVLTALQLYSPACDLMLKVLFGTNLPQIESVFGWRSPETQLPNLKFNQSRPIFESGNLKVMEILAEKRLSSPLATTYGPELTCQVTTIQSFLRIAIAASFSCVPTDTSKLIIRLPHPKPRAQDFISADDEDHKKPKRRVRRVGGRTVEQLLGTTNTEKPSIVVEEDEANSDVEAENTGVTRVLTSSNSQPTFSLVAGLLLDAAYQDLNAIYMTLSSTPVGDLSPSELDFFIQSLIGLGRIYEVRQQRTEQAQHLMKALNALQKHPLFTNSDHSYNTDNFWDVDSRVRLDVKLWMNIRLELTGALLEEVREMGAIGGEVWIDELGRCRMHCAEGVLEAEKYEDNSLTAQYLYLATLLDIKEGKPIPNIMENLVDCIGALEGDIISSVYEYRIFICAKVLHGDLQALDWFRKTEDDVENDRMAESIYKTYSEALQFAVDLGFKYGEIMEKRREDEAYSTIQAPIKNLFSTTYLPLLAHIKLRLGHCLCRMSVKYDPIRESAMKISTLKKAVGLLSTALSIARAMSQQQPNLEAEILFQKGRALRQLFILGQIDARTVVVPLKEAIVASYYFNHDLGLMRQAYMEMGMTFMAAIGTPGVPLPPGMEARTPDNPLYRETTTEKKERESKKDPSPPAKKVTKSKKQVKKTAADLKKEKEEREQMKEVEMNRKAAWGAVKGAALVALAQQNLFMLPAEEEVLKNPISQVQKDKLPAFCMDDLAKSHGYRDVDVKVAGKSRGEMTSMELIYGEKFPDPPPTIESFVSWVHILGYSALVERLGGMLAFVRPGTVEPHETSSHISEATFAYYEHPMIEIGLQQTFLRTPVFGINMNLRCSAMHEYLKINLPNYANGCCAPFPADFLTPPSKSEQTLDVFEHNYDDQSHTATGTTDSTDTKTGQPDTSSKQQTAAHPPALVSQSSTMSLGSLATQTGGTVSGVAEKPSDLPFNDGELAVQWYISPLDGPIGDCMLLVYSMGKKILGPKPKDKDDPYELCAGVLPISISSLMNLHDMLMTLLQRADVQLAAVEKIPSRRHRPVIKSKKATKKVQDLKKDEKLEKSHLKEKDLFNDCLKLVLQLFTEIDDGLTRPEQIPSLSTKVTQVRVIEQTFNLTSGSLIKSSEFGRWISKLLIPPPANAVSPSFNENPNEQTLTNRSK